MTPAGRRHVVVVGERDPTKRAHEAIEASFACHQRDGGDAAVTYEWLRTDAITPATVSTHLAEASGVWCAPGSPYASTAGALLAIGYAREQNRAFLGTCGGFQHALMEYQASVLGQEATHAELDPDAAQPLIVKLSCSLVGAHAAVHATPGSRYEQLVGPGRSVEEFNCSYGMAPEFEHRFDGSELEFVARDDAGQVRVFWHRRHPFFAGCLFQPERRAFAGALHPLVRAFLTRV